MSTPDFLAQSDEQFTDIRYYTENDPYYYTIDNRPLLDIESNLKLAREGGGDAGRRASLINSLGLNALNAHLFMRLGYTQGMSGLGVVQVSNNVARVNPGAVYDTRAISATNTDGVVKMALATKSTDFTITAPLSAGTSLVYTVEATFTELNATTMATTRLPYMDATNAFLPSTLLNGELVLSLNTGVAATTGTQVPPATTAGKIPLYNITIAQGSTTFAITRHDRAPFSPGLNHRVTPVALTATAGTLDENQIFTCLKSGTQGVIAPITLGASGMNAYTPVKLKVAINPTVTGNNAAFRLRYKGSAAGDLTSVAKISSAIQAVPITAVAGAVQTFTTTINVPNTEFAGFVSGNWTFNKDHLNIILERVGTDAADTNTGDIRIMGITLVQ